MATLCEGCSALPITDGVKCRSHTKYMANFKQMSELTNLPGTIQLLKVNCLKCFAAPGSIL